MDAATMFLCCLLAIGSVAPPAVSIPTAVEEQNEEKTIANVVIQTTVGPQESTAEIPVQTTSFVSATESVTETPVIPTEPNTETLKFISTESTTETPVTTTEPDTETPIVETTVEPTTEAATDAAITNDFEVSTQSSIPIEVVKDKLSEQIRKILKHYQRPDPTGFPGAPIPDPLKIPPMKRNFGMADMTFTNMTVHGLSKFQVDRVNTDLKKMQVYVLLKIKRMYVLGNYTLKSWFQSAKGPFNVTLINVDAATEASMEPDQDGVLVPTNIEMDMRFKDCELDFKNLGLVASLFQGVISTLGSSLFEGIKPFIITEMHNTLMTDLNGQVRAITKKLPKMDVPIPDLAIAEGRAYVRRMGYDPYHLADRHMKEGPLNITISNLTIVGLSDFRRVGDIGLQIRGPVLQLTVHVVTRTVNGSLRWKYDLGLNKIFSRTGESNFTVDHIQVRAVVNQTLDVRNKPVLDKLDIEVGTIEAHMDRKETVDYVIEMVVNSLPKLMRHIIVDILEEPIKMKVQTILDDVQLEQMIEERLPELDRLTET
ncbi:Haemolymph juvenile hormone binding,Bactericidal permeability-increasing protein, alpha/beta domain,Mite [Cinara cedri]|uniref:Haemolymph juvenile hormone binding,Bactericidal permeability-increasing protein, alpha/beta domain,Mite n=1 Tax=Cinara cedri TaxID=506608 RepID=A0A5E4NKI7_9HEMI|nr:Haemolymph juvenile hormone binding,Bactericidal permeability-increasing protein, alpha/beta domain,Mite [Cinara cedri]